LDPRSLLFFLWRSWKLILFAAVVPLPAAFIWLATATPRYTASTQILLDPINEKLASADIASLNFLDSLTMDNQIAIVKSSKLLRRVVEKEHLAHDDEFGSPSAQSSASPSPLDLYASRALEALRGHFARAQKALLQRAQVSRSYFPGPHRADVSESARVADRGPEVMADVVGQEAIEAGDFDGVPREVVGAIGSLGGAVTAKRVGQGDVLSISVTSTRPAQAARLANAVALAFLLDPLYSRLEAARRTSDWVNERLPELRERLRESERAVVAFRAEHNLLGGGQNVSAGQEQNLSLNQEQLAQINARLAEARADVAEKKAKTDLLEKLEAEGGDAMGLPETVSSPLLADLRKQFAEVEGKEVGLAVRNGERYPERIKLRAQQANLQQAIAAEMQQIAKKVRNEYSLALARQETFESILRAATGRTSLDNKEAIQLRDLERTASVNKSLLEDFLKRASLLQEESLNEARVGRVIAPAIKPDAPSSPNRSLILSVALGLGLVSGIGLSWAREQMSPGFTTSSQAEDLLSQPLLVAINRMRPRDARIEERPTSFPRLVRQKPLAAVSDAGRTLRSGIQMINVETPPKILQVTSAVAREGKTTTALLLTMSSAASGLKTLIVDANLRNSAITRHFGLHQHMGLANLMLDEASFDDATRFYESHGLWVMPAGAAHYDFGDIITAERVRNLVEQCRAAGFDCVVFDTPAVGQAAEARVISSFVDKVVFVVKWAATPKEVVSQNIKLIERHGKIAGVAFNFVDRGLAKKYNDFRLLSA
jgi:capsular exopolysaccharide synthesis family protein